MKLSPKKLGAILGILCLAVILSLPSREPSFEGRRVSQWLESYGRRWDMSPHAVRAEKAMDHFGTNAIPAMLVWINYEPPRPWKNKSWSQSTNFWMRAIKKLPIISESINRREYRAAGALENFQRLGPRAESAIPDLNRMVGRLKTSQVQRPVIALTYLGTNAVPAMTSALTNRNITCRHIVADALYGLGTNARPAYPVLLQCLREDPDPTVRAAACSALGRMKIDPVRVLPGLAEAVSDPSAGVRWRALHALRLYGTNTRPVAPMILKALNDPDTNVQKCASNTLRIIAPDLVPQIKP